MFKRFKSPITTNKLPERFNFPFYYEPDPIAKHAAKELQEHLISQKDWKHYFGLPGDDSSLQNGIPIGKMFGVLVVQTKENEIGYLCAFSGKLADSNHLPGFVPPVFDMLKEGDFFKDESQEIIAINQAIEEIEESGTVAKQEQEIEVKIQGLKQELQLKQKIYNDQKKVRKRIREEAIKTLSEREYKELHEKHKEESLKQTYFHRLRSKEIKKEIEVLQDLLDQTKEPLAQLKKSRKEKSALLQHKLFDAYAFLNAKGEEKSLLSIFKDTVLKRPPAGAGECAAPKLLHYAFENELHPIALAEFWWGAPPSEDVKQHKQYYPACKGKCEPILGHMLEGLDVEPNPLLIHAGKNNEIEILYEEQDFLVINKPPELLSVPGKTITDSVYNRIKATYPKADGPIIVHRLDMSTSGLMVIALNKRSHDYLQRQFIKRQVKKRYVALLEGLIEPDSGSIDLPLGLDFLDRPKQKVDRMNGKKAITTFQVEERLNGKTKIFFYPETGRTHQLRVHAAHREGLNSPIVGDDLYGNKGQRLHLHAQQLSFRSPSSGETVHFECSENF